MVNKTNYLVIFCLAFLLKGFSQDTLIHSMLPIVYISTGGQTINADSNIVADMGIIFNGLGEFNHVDDSLNNYDGKIAIRHRGNTSLSFPKKSYTIETQDTAGQNLNVGLIDLPEENDWVLYGPYSDKSLMRNTLMYELARRLGWYAPRTRYCEVILDGVYQGVYVFTEKIKRDNDRLDIATITQIDTTGDELTGGYIILLDRYDGEGWHSLINNKIYFEYYEPDDGDILPVQKAYIRNFINTFEAILDTMTRSNYSLLDTIIDFSSFCDHIILNELSKNIDAYRLSTYMFKDKNSNDQRLKMGPIWDFNIALGNNFDHQLYTDSNFIYNDTNVLDHALFWFKKLMDFPHFADSCRCRWDQLRTGALSANSIHTIIDSTYEILQMAQARNFYRWDILGIPVWPNYYVGETYEEEVQIVKTWIDNRLAWLDENLPGDCYIGISEYNPLNKSPVLVSPNPFSNELRITVKSGFIQTLQFDLFNLYGKMVYSSNTIKSLQTGQDIRIDLTGNGFTNSPYFYRITLNGSDVNTGIIIKHQ